MNPILEHFANHDFVIVGHRGAAGLAPENTLQSFSAALQWRCPMIELDVHAASDKVGQIELMVIHDHRLNRTTNGRGSIRDFTTDQLRDLDAGNRQPIPFLTEVVDLLNKNKADTGRTVALNIELKGPDTARPVAALLAEIDPLPVLVSSFDHDELQRFRGLNDTTPVAPLYRHSTAHWQQIAANLAATTINIRMRLATRRTVGEMKKAGYPVFVFTVNSVRDARRLRDMGVSGVYTDRPDKLMALAAHHMD